MQPCQVQLMRSPAKPVAPPAPLVASEAVGLANVLAQLVLSCRARLAQPHAQDAGPRHALERRVVHAPVCLARIDDAAACIQLGLSQTEACDGAEQVEGSSGRRRPPLPPPLLLLLPAEARPLSSSSSCQGFHGLACKDFAAQKFHLIGSVAISGHDVDVR